MSARRSSRAASARQASPASATPSRLSRTSRATPSKVGTFASPRRPRNEELPATSTKTSTAYGTNDISQVGRAQRPQVSAQIDNVLKGILRPIPEDDTASITTTRSTRATKRGGSKVASRGVTPVDPNNSASFNEESGVFGQAGVDSSLQVAEDVSQVESDLSDVEEEEEEGGEQDLPEKPSAPSQAEILAKKAQRVALERASRERVKRQRQRFAEDVSANVEAGITWLSLQLKINRDLLCRIIKWSAIALTTLWVSWFIAVSLPSSSYHNYGMSPGAWKHNVGQFLPSGSVFSSDDVNEIRSRITDAEREIIKLQQRSDMDKKTLSKLESILPEFIVGTKDRYGQTILPEGLWLAIKDKIQTDTTLVVEGRKGENAVSTKDVNKAVSKSFEKFIKENEFKIRAAQGDNIDKRFSALIESAISSGVLIRKSDVIDRIEQNWRDNQPEIKREMEKITKELNQVTRSVSQLSKGPTPISKSEVQTIAKEIFNKMLPNSQLRALSNANMQANVKHALHRVNHFSPGTGAVINPHLVSPNYVFPSMDVNMFSRAWRSFVLNPLPIPKPPSEALNKWDEHGDCWCTPTQNKNRSPPTLPVIMGSDIYPEEVVIEHIASTAALEPGATPREMELLAYIPELERYNTAKAISAELFPEEAANDHELPYRYVRVATWVYDMASDLNAQAFPVQMDLKQFNAHTNHLMVRARSNWGSKFYTCFYRVRVHGPVVVTPGSY